MQMFHNLGVEWVGTLLGCLGVAFMPIPFLFYTFGDKLRKKSSYAPTDLGTSKKNSQDKESQKGVPR